MDRMLATTMIEPPTLSFGASAAAESRRSRRDSFWSQTPLALLAFGAVAAIVAVNRPATPTQVAPATTQGVVLAPMSAVEASRSCIECGEVLSVQLVSLHPDTAPSIKTFELSVRMQDGTLHTVRQFAPVFDVGDRVRLSRNALALRG